MKLSKIFREVYDATSSSKSGLGKVMRYAYPFNAPYLARDAWRKYCKNLFGFPTSAASLNISGGDVHGPTGSIVGKY